MPAYESLFLLIVQGLEIHFEIESREQFRWELALYLGPRRVRGENYGIAIEVVLIALGIRELAVLEQVEEEAPDC